VALSVLHFDWYSCWSWHPTLIEEMKLLLYRVATLFFTTTEKSVGIRRVAGRVGISPLVRVNSGVLGKGTADMDKLRFTSFTKKGLQSSATASLDMDKLAALATERSTRILEAASLLFGSRPRSLGKVWFTSLYASGGIWSKAWKRPEKGSLRMLQRTMCCSFAASSWGEWYAKFRRDR